MSIAPDEAEIAALVAGEKLREAAAACVLRGDSARAVELLVRASLPAEAADVAEAAGDLMRAVRLAADAAAHERLERLAPRLSKADAARLALELDALHRPLGAAFLHARAEDDGAAGEAFARAGEATRAALSFVRAGDDRAGARVLGERLSASPGDEGAALALATICLRHGRFEAAAAALQRAREHGELGVEARAALARALGELGVGDRVPAPPAAPPEAPRAVLFGRWEVVSEVAASPTARVLLAIDRLRGARVAIKLLRPASGPEGRDAIARLEREAVALALLRHPRVVPLVAWVREGPALVLAWMEGGSLERALAEGPFSPARAAEVARAVLEALAAAHRIGIVHRDVKPANVLFDGAAAPYLADFGAAHVGDAAATVTAGLIGTLAYMAPEQREGRPAEIGSDLYAVGAIFHEALTGAPPRALGPPPSATHACLHAGHDALLARFLADAPGARPASAEDAIAELGALPWPDIPPPPRPSPAPSARPPPRPRYRPRGAGIARDDVLEREVVLVPLDDASRALARAYARADDDALACVLSVDVNGKTIVVEAPPGALLARPLYCDEARALARALGALHREGAAHGAVDARHVFVDPVRGVLLAFPRTRAEGASPAADLAALARLHA